MSELTNTEIDRKCAEVIMGWEMEKDWHGEYWTEGNGIFARPTIYESYCSHWTPSTNLNQAWQVVEKIMQQPCSILNISQGYRGKLISVDFSKKEDGIRGELHCVIGEAKDESLPRAICLACIQAWEGK